MASRNRTSAKSVPPRGKAEPAPATDATVAGAERQAHRRAVLVVLVALGLLLPSWALTAWFAVHERGPGGPQPQPAVTGPPPPVASIWRAEQASWRPGKPGPWGQLETLEIRLEEPDDYLELEICDQPADVWWLPGYSRQQAEALLASAPLPPAELAGLVAALSCGPADGGCRVSPGAELAFAVSPAARSVIYSSLARFPQNQHMVYGFRWRSSRLEDWLASAGLEGQTVSVLRNLLWQHGEYAVFSDLAILCPHLSSDAERKRTLQALSGSPALMARLLVPHGADVGALLDYWGPGQRRAELKPVLDSLATLPDGGTVELALLLPPFARNRLYAFPLPADPPWSCFWSALNFQRLVPDDRYLANPAVRDALASAYEPVLDRPPQFGDVILLQRAEGTSLHAVVYVADDVVFTKNGRSHHRPWLLERLADVTPRYPEATRLAIYRLKPSADPNRADRSLAGQPSTAPAPAAVPTPAAPSPPPPPPAPAGRPAAPEHAPAPT